MKGTGKFSRRQGRSLGLGILLAALILCGVIGAGAGSVAYAKTPDNVTWQISGNRIEGTVRPDTEDLADNEELFAEYVDHVFYGDTETSTLSNYGETVLDEKGQVIYRGAKELLAEIADGERASAIIDVDTTGMTWTAEEAGTSSVDELFYDVIVDMLVDVYYCLLSDCPYELYWHDKTIGCGIGIEYETIPDNSDLPEDEEETFEIFEMTDVFFYMYVSVDYQGEDEFTVDTEKTSAASRSAANAKEIVAEYDSLSDWEKVVKYKEEICELTSYNFEASEDPDMPYGDPETEVVCEGYSKAFQYLCDMGLTDAASYIVTGVASSSLGGGGGHMWNVLTLEGGNYLVDVTNSDEGASGEYGGLFLVDDTNASFVDPALTYSFDVKDRTITYTYDDDTIELYSDGIRTLGGASHLLTITEQPQDLTLTYGYAGETLTMTAETDGSPIWYQWYERTEDGSGAAIDGATDSVFAVPEGMEAGEQAAYYCEATHIGDEVTSADALVSVDPRPVTVTIADAERTQGEENPAFTWEITEGTLADGDDASALGITLFTEATADSEAGTYAISGTADSSNYAVTIVPGTLTITAAVEEPVVPTDPDSGSDTSSSSVGAVKTADPDYMALWLILLIASMATAVAVRRR